MKLEIKHLAPYLPYGLECHVMGLTTEESMYTDNPKPILTKMVGLYTDIRGSEYAECTHSEYTDDVYINTDLFPILRPLSDLTKEIEFNGEKFVPIDNFIFKTSVEDFTEFPEQKHNLIPTLKYMDVQLLLEWHFDIFSLIENNLAINVNDIK